ncbi:MAG: hypothetical protein ABIG56_02265 [Candidatus Omnitrophota bacterium]
MSKNKADKYNPYIAYRACLERNRGVSHIGLVCLFIVAFFTVANADQDYVFDAGGKRNPFSPLVTSEGLLLKLDAPRSGTGLYLEGIIFDENGKSYAIVNAEVVMVGDRVNDYQLLKIEKNKVFFSKEGQITEILLEKEGE